MGNEVVEFAKKKWHSLKCSSFRSLTCLTISSLVNDILQITTETIYWLQHVDDEPFSSTAVQDDMVIIQIID